MDEHEQTQRRKHRNGNEALAIFDSSKLHSHLSIARDFLNIRHCCFSFPCTHISPSENQFHSNCVPFKPWRRNLTTMLSSIGFNWVWKSIRELNRFSENGSENLLKIHLFPLVSATFLRRKKKIWRWNCFAFDNQTEIQNYIRNMLNLTFISVNFHPKCCLFQVRLVPLELLHMDWLLCIEGMLDTHNMR